MSLRPKPEQERALHEALQVFHFAQTCEQLQSESAYAGGRNAITLRKAPGMQVVMLAQQAGNILPDHRAAGPIMLHVLRGRIRCTAAGQTVDLAPEMALALDDGIVHSVEALEDSISLLTIGKHEQ